MFLGVSFSIQHYCKLTLWPSFLSSSTFCLSSDGLPRAQQRLSDGYSDIAQRDSSEMMRIDATGRIPYQKVYLATSSSVKSTNATYNPDKEVLTNGPKLAEGNELVEAENTKLFLKVGLIHGKDPNNFLATGNGRDKKREAAKKQRGVQDRDEHAMRVFVPFTEPVKTQTKYYVGCFVDHTTGIENRDIAGTHTAVHYSAMYPAVLRSRRYIRLSPVLVVFDGL